MREKLYCKVCGKEIGTTDEIPLGPEALKEYCMECFDAGIKWGMQKWIEAGAPGAKKR